MPVLPKAIEAIHLAGLAAAMFGLNLQFEHHAGLVASSGPCLCHVTFNIFNAMQPATLKMVLAVLRARAIGLWVEPSWMYCRRLMFAIGGLNMQESKDKRGKDRKVSDFS